MLYLNSIKSLLIFSFSSFWVDRLVSHIDNKLISLSIFFLLSFSKNFSKFSIKIFAVILFVNEGISSIKFIISLKGKYPFSLRLCKKLKKIGIIPPFDLGKFL